MLRKGMEPTDGDSCPGFGTSHGPGTPFILYPLSSALCGQKPATMKAGERAVLQCSEQTCQTTNSFICH